MSDKPQPLSLVSDEVEQSEAIQDTVRLALSVLRTKRIRTFAFVAIEDNEDETRHHVIGRDDGTNEMLILGAIEELKFGYLKAGPL